jgi:hypothetical protein
MWHHHDPQFFLLLAGSFAAFLTPSAIDELIRKFRARGRAAKKLTRQEIQELEMRSHFRL